MADLEELVRPFQEPTPDPPRPGILSYPKPRGNIVAQFGASGGGGKIFSGSFHKTITLYMKKVVLEKGTVLETQGPFGG